MRIARPVLAVCLAATVAGAALAQSAGGDLAITHEVVAGGGAVAAGGAFGATTTAAQHALGSARGGDFELHGGFHLPAVAQLRGDAIFSDGFEGGIP